MIATPKCFTRRCRHFLGVRQDNAEEETERFHCAAYPDGPIPNEIAYGTDRHTTVRADQDNDIVYERKNDEQ